MKALESFDTTITYCFTPEHCGIRPHYTSAPQNVQEFAEFCERRRYVTRRERSICGRRRLKVARPIAVMRRATHTKHNRVPLVSEALWNRE